MGKISDYRPAAVIGKLTTKRCPYCAMRGGTQMKVRQVIDNTVVLECTNQDCGHIAHNLASNVDMLDRVED